MVTPLALWLSPSRRRGWCGDPSKIPTHLDDVLAELPSLRPGFDAPSAHLREGRFYAGGGSSSWHVQSSHPYVRVYVFPTPASWCAAELRSRMPPLYPVAIPVPPGRSRLYPDSGLPPAFGALTHDLSQYEGVYGWSAQPIERVHEWLDAAAEYLTRQRAILTGLADWAAEAAALDPRKAGHSKRITLAVPAQRRVMEQLVEASAAYRPVLNSVRDAVGGRTGPDPAVNPETVLLDWASERTWLIVKDPDRDRMVVYRESEFQQDLLSKQSWAPMQVTVRGVAHRLTDFIGLSATYLVERGDSYAKSAIEVVWDERSIELCDREIAELWADLDAEHDLPGDFASVWKAFFGYDHRSVFARKWTGTQEPPGTLPPTKPKRRSRYGSGDGSGGGGEYGFYGGIAVAGGDSGAGGCGSGGGSCGGGGGCGGGGCGGG